MKQHSVQMLQFIIDDRSEIADNRQGNQLQETYRKM